MEYFNHRTYSEEYKPTKGFEFHEYNYEVNETLINLKIWDFSGMELYENLLSKFYKSEFNILVFSVDK